MMRTALATCLLLLLVVLCAPAIRASAPASGQPDVLLITIDTLRADHLSVYGYPGPITPNLDRLLSRGARFSNTRTVEPLTNPSMTSMITSMHPHRHGGTRNGLRMRHGLNSLPKILAEQGYETAAFVSNWTLKPKVSGLEEHFLTYRAVLTRKRWFGLVRSEAVAGDLTAAALRWLDERSNPSRPILLWVHYSDPHAPYRFHETEGRTLGVTKGKKADAYATEVAFTDRAVGEMLAGFRERRGAGGEPLIVFCADHGESLGEHGYWGHGRHLYETELQIPMGIVQQGSFAPGTLSGPASILDLAPTILGLLRIPVPESFTGYDWSSVLRGGEAPEGRITHHQTHRGAVMVRHQSRQARRKGLLAVALVREDREEFLRTESEETLLFDVGFAPSASRPVEPPPAGPSAALRAWLTEVLTGLEAIGPVDQPLSEKSLEKLRSLGYVD